jgi:hypothetical protein
MVISLLGPYLWTCWCALQSPSCAGGLLQLTIVMADCRGGLRVAVARVQIDVRIRCLSGFSRDHTAGVAWAIVGGAGDLPIDMLLFETSQHRSRTPMHKGVHSWT